MIPLMMQKEYSPKGYVRSYSLDYATLRNATQAWLTLFVLMDGNYRWLGLILGTRMWYGSSD
jgi:hypothetical protein